MFSYTYYIILILLLEEKTILLCTHPIADICFVSIQAWNLNMIQCGSRNLTAVPPDIPMDATAVHLDGNAMGTVLTETFLGRTRLALLFLNSSALTAITNRTFLGLRALKGLHLEHNRLTDLSWPLLFPDSPGLEELYLHHNRLQVLGRETLSGLTRLRVLTLHNNQLVSLGGQDSLGAAQLPALRTLTTGKNPWTCSCELALTLSRLGQQRSGLEQVTCRPLPATGRGTEPEPVLRYMQAACRELDVLPVSSPAAALPPWLVLAICCLAGGAGTILVAFMVLLSQRNNLTRWIHARKGCTARGGEKVEDEEEESSQYSPMLKVTASSLRLTTSPEAERQGGTVEYGVYLHYCLADDDYVRELLAPRLVSRCEKRLRLCLHHRDLRPAATVGEAISEAVRLSDCLFILASSSYFLSSVAICELQLILSAVMPRLPSFSVIVAVPPQGGGRSQVRSQLSALAGGLTQGWTYLAAADPLFYHHLSATLQQQLGGGGNPPPPSLSSSSAASSCSTRSTGLGSGQPPGPRIITNPLDNCETAAGWGEAVYATVADQPAEQEDELSYQTLYTDQFRTLHGAPPSRQQQQSIATNRFRTLQ